MKWQLPASLLTSAVILSAATIYASVNAHRSRWCMAMTSGVAIDRFPGAADLGSTRSLADWSDRELGFRITIDECRSSLVPWR